MTQNKIENRRRKRVKSVYLSRVMREIGNICSIDPDKRQASLRSIPLLSCQLSEGSTTLRAIDSRDYFEGLQVSGGDTIELVKYLAGKANEQTENFFDSLEEAPIFGFRILHPGNIEQTIVLN
jgi:hypothetical protein